MEREKKTQTLAMKVQSSLFERLTGIAETEDRPIGYVARELMLRGLGLYELDGRLRDARPTTAGGEKATVVARIGPASSSAEADDERDTIRRQFDVEEPERRRKAS